MNLVSFVDNVFCEEFCFSLRSPSSSFVIMTQPNADVVISIFVGQGVADILMQLGSLSFPFAVVKISHYCFGNTDYNKLLNQYKTVIMLQFNMV